MAKAVDITGQIFGDLTVIKRDGSKDNRAMWLCKCSCGNERRVSGTDLRRGRIKSCGCKNKNVAHLENQKFGLLTILEKTNERDYNGNIMWKCQCDCGNIINVASSKLISGNTKSCGCERIKKLIEFNKTRALDITDQIFGELIALEPTEKRSKEKSIIWKCQCSCGNITEIPIKDLVSGNTKSCGCKKNKSFGEEKIIQILNKNNISFIREYTPININNLSFKPRFDFYLPFQNILIEYDGIQHFKKGNGYYDNEKKFKITQNHDNIKNQWCRDNNIPLIRIPYTHYNDLCLEDLLLETSKFII